DSVTFTDATMSSADFFGYSGGYFAATTIQPAQAYWVKVSATGTNPQMCLRALSVLPPKGVAAGLELMEMNKLIITDKAGYAQTLYLGDETIAKAPASAYEMPPPAPVGMDVRFSSGRIAEIYPTKFDPNGVYEYPIAINNATYPITIRWEVTKQAERQIVLTDAAGQGVIGNTILDGSGRMQITNVPPSGMKNLVIKLSEGLAVPKAFALDQNYPNPFNAVTEIKYQIPENSYVILKVFNVLGQEVATLVNEKKTSGQYTVSWDASNQPSGVYFYRLTADKFIAVKKMLFIR
ncbi:MAG: T9SS type A sorting domain-containing protein, partial [Ignavibacteriae bacterium]|nr:T9SS type A sorting domain-containing protein [Ignavibacteriota bacterium]